MGKINDRAREFGDGPIEDIDVQKEEKKIRPIDRLLKRKDIPQKDQVVMEKIDINRDFVLPSDIIRKIDDKLTEALKRIDEIGKNVIEIQNVQEKLRTVIDELEED